MSHEINPPPLSPGVLLSLQRMMMMMVRSMGHSGPLAHLSGHRGRHQSVCCATPPSAWLPDNDCTRMHHRFSLKLILPRTATAAYFCGVCDSTSTAYICVPLHQKSQIYLSWSPCPPYGQHPPADSRQHLGRVRSNKNNLGLLGWGWV